MNNQQVRKISEAGFKARFGGIGALSINIKPGFDPDDDPLVDVRIIYDAAFEDLNAEGTMNVCSEIIDMVWYGAEKSPCWPHVHFISKTDLVEGEDPATV